MRHETRLAAGTAVGWMLRYGLFGLGAAMLIDLAMTSVFPLLDAVRGTWTAPLAAVVLWGLAVSFVVAPGRMVLFAFGNVAVIGLSNLGLEGLMPPDLSPAVAVGLVGGATACVIVALRAGLYRSLSHLEAVLGVLVLFCLLSVVSNLEAGRFLHPVDLNNPYLHAITLIVFGELSAWAVKARLQRDQLHVARHVRSMRLGMGRDSPRRGAAGVRR